MYFWGHSQDTDKRTERCNQKIKRKFLSLDKCNPVMKYLILANDVHLSIVNPTKLKVGTHEWSIKVITYYIIVITYYIIAILGIYLDQPSTNFGTTDLGRLVL